MRLPEVRLMRAAVVLSEELSYRRAADKLNIVQSTLSRQILELEDQLGYRLFTRSNQRVELNEAGGVFAKHAREASLNAELAVKNSHAAFLGTGAILKVGKSPNVDPYLITILKSISLPLYPDLRLNFSSMFSSDLEQMVGDGKLDFAILVGPSENQQLTIVELSTVPLYILMSAGDNLADGYDVNLQDLGDREWILFERHVNSVMYDRIMLETERLNLKTLSVQHFISAEEAAQMLDEKNRIAFLTSADAFRTEMHGLTMRPLTNKSLLLRTALVIRADNRSRVLSELTRAFKRRLSVQTLTQISLPLKNQI
jgi:DNA-binding transcriptional LysR family regulator